MGPSHIYTFQWDLLVCCCLTTGILHAFVIEGSTNSSICPQTCTCNIDSVSCASRRLTHVPDFGDTMPSSITYVSLKLNQISSVDAYAFSAFKNSINVNLYMNSNKITSISPHAFVNIENVTSRIDLQFNRLTELPRALGTLTNLKQLSIHDNPLLMLDANVMSNLGESLTNLVVDFGNMPTWPSELSYLRHLKSLVIYRNHFVTIDEGAFLAFGNTLDTLDFHSINVTSISSAICYLNKLHHLHISNSPSLNETQQPIFEPCPLNVSKLDLQSLNLRNNEFLSNFPILSKTFSSIKNVRIEKCMLNTITINDSFPLDTVISLYLTDNNFVNIPNDVSKFVNLHRLSLGKNHIKIVQNNTMDLAYLTILTLSENPLSYIYNSAFKHNTHLMHLDFSDTPLHNMPSSLRSLFHLGTLDLSHTQIECACNLASVKYWNVTSIDFKNALCFNSDESIKDVIMYHLVNC